MDINHVLQQIFIYMRINIYVISVIAFQLCLNNNYGYLSQGKEFNERHDTVSVTRAERYLRD